MQVNPYDGLPGVTNPSTRKATKPPTVGQDGPAETASARLRLSLETTPEVRPEKVARARALMAEPEYPSENVLGQLATLLAQHLR
jgi:hypothetical protein